MKDGINKTAGLGDGIEDSGITDSKTGLPIRISIGVRKLYRTTFDEQGASNKEINQIMASDFSSDAGGVVHYFPSKTTPGSWLELRRSSKKYINYYVSIRRASGNSITSIDIIKFQTDILPIKSQRLKIPGR